MPDTAASIKIAGPDRFETSEIKFVASPYDEYGIEEAVILVEAHQGIWVKTDNYFLDPATTARALKAAVIVEAGLRDQVKVMVGGAPVT